MRGVAVRCVITMARRQLCLQLHDLICAIAAVNRRRVGIKSATNVARE